MEKTILNVLSENTSLIDEKMTAYLAHGDADDAVLYEAMRYSAMGGGKRIRPTLVLEFCRLYGGDIRVALPYACALEMIHTYSLIHDDLPCMDNDDFRRGRPTSHRRFGEATALLAGDALLTYAFEVSASNPYASAAQSLQAIQILSAYAGPAGMVGGQQIDLLAENTKIGYETLLKMNRKKTGCLIEAACRLGCLAAGQNDHRAAIAYAQAVGLAFQIEDDILDAGEEDEKTTFLSFMTIEQAHEKAAELTQTAHEALRSLEGREVLDALADYLCTRKV